MATDFTIASLCAGGGGLERAIGLCVESARVVVYVEREAFACEVLATAHEQVGVGPAVLWPDLLTFDGRPWRGVIDCVAAGIPCQPHSVAGKRLGAADERNLWPATQRIIGEVEPPFVFLENVGGSVPFFGEHVVCGLEGMGYRVEAGLFEAAEIGAPMRGCRLFVLAAAKRGGLPPALHESELETSGQQGKTVDAIGPIDSLWPPGPCQVIKIPREIDGLAGRADRLRLLGNGVVDLQGAYAFCALLSRLRGRLT